MFKLAALALATTLAAGTTYVVAHGHPSTRSPQDVASTTAPPATPHRTSARAPLTLPAFRRINVLGALGARGGVPEVTCAAAAAHMANLAFDGATDLPPDNTEGVDHAARHFEQICLDQHWSKDYMACVLGSSDSYSTMLDCAEYATADMGFDGSAKQPEGTFVIENRKDPIAPTTDTSCAGVAKHMAALTEPDPAAIAALPADKRDAILQGIAAARRTVPAQMEKGCTDAGWTDTRRACIAAATTMMDMAKCE